MKISGIQNVSDIFNVFHDGGIIGYKVKGADLELYIEIQYLAERINTMYTSFKVCIFHSENLVLQPWYDDHDKKEPYITDIERIFSPELEV